MFNKIREFIKGRVWILRAKWKIRNRQITPKGLYFLQYLHEIQEGKDVYVQAYEDSIERRIDALGDIPYNYEEKRQIVIQHYLDLLGLFK